MKEIKIDGVISQRTKDPFTEDIFLDKFFKFLADNGWYFGGATKDISKKQEMYAIGLRNHVRGWEYCYGPVADLQDCLNARLGDAFKDEHVIMELRTKEENVILYRWSNLSGKWMDMVDKY